MIQDMLSLSLGRSRQHMTAGAPLLAGGTAASGRSYLAPVGSFEPSTSCAGDSVAAATPMGGPPTAGTRPRGTSA